MAGWEDLDQALPLDVRDVAQAREDLDRLALRVLVLKMDRSCWRGYVKQF